MTIGYPRKKVIRARSLKNGLILYEDFELRNEVTVTFPIEGIFQNFFNFKLPHTHSITPATWHDINPAGYRAVAPTQTRPFSCIPPYGSGTLNQAVYVLGDKYLGEAYFPGSVGAEK